jgi:hypothetical protein
MMPQKQPILLLIIIQQQLLILFWSEEKVLTQIWCWAPYYPFNFCHWNSETDLVWFGLVWFDLIWFCFVLFCYVLGAQQIGEMGMEECELWIVRAGPREGGGCEIK